ncbi:hypothetical protein [Aquimarina sp. RZ0]|uniref:hypothetical protein n=1 Tax=Aquimarina sp. RZ0 TaxID=2607730 RepID=UPI00165F07D6|nr:hypothetical protein [Aquimarina sp. RZ0]
MAVEIKNLSIKIQINGNESQVRDDGDEISSEWSQDELIALIEKSLHNKKER